MRLIDPITITDAMILASNVPETDYGEYAAGTTYAATDRVMIASLHEVYESISSGNVGNYPPTDCLLATPHWFYVGKTNKWKAFDQAISSQTELAESITYQIQLSRMIDEIAFLGCDSIEITVVGTDPVAGEIYNETISTIQSTVTDWYSFFFSGIAVKKPDCLFSAIPPYTNAVYDITISYPGSTAKVGCIIFGLDTPLGDSELSPTIGIKDYSIKSTDDFGNTTFLERAYSKKMSYDFVVFNDMLDVIAALLPQYRAIPVVYIGSGYTSSIIFGKYNDFSIVVSYDEFSICSIEIEGLT